MVVSIARLQSTEYTLYAPAHISTNTPCTVQLCIRIKFRSFTRNKNCAPPILFCVCVYRSMLIVHFFQLFFTSSLLICLLGFSIPMFACLSFLSFHFTFNFWYRLQLIVLGKWISSFSLFNLHHTKNCKYKFYDDVTLNCRACVWVGLRLCILWCAVNLLFCSNHLIERANGNEICIWLIPFMAQRVKSCRRGRRRRRCHCHTITICVSPMFTCPHLYFALNVSSSFLFLFFCHCKPLISNAKNLVSKISCSLGKLDTVDEKNKQIKPKTPNATTTR